MSAKRGKTGFTERWVWYHLAGWLLGIVLILTLDPLDDFLGWNTGKAPVGIAMALGVGLMEWAFLRKFGIKPSWIIATVLGFAVVFLLCNVLQKAFFPQVPDEVLVLYTALGAFLSGWIQLYSTKNHLKKWNWAWPLRYMLGWTTAALLSMSVVLVRSFHLPPILAFVLALLLMLSGAPVLAWITAPFVQAIAKQQNVVVSQDSLSDPI